MDEARLDEAVINLMTARIKLGTIQMPGEEKNQFDDISYGVVDCLENRKLNKEAAARSIVMLKNQNQILPLDKTKIKTIGVIGPNADNRRSLTGNYEGTASHYWTVLEGLQNYLGEDTRVLYSQGCHLWEKYTVGLAANNNLRAEVNAVCEHSDVVIACMGLDATFEGEEGDAWSDSESKDGDKANLLLPGLQQKILEEIVSSGKPVILLLLSGSALAIDWAHEHVQGILQCWYPGAEGGRAIAELLFGEHCPEGKMPVTFYKESYKLPDFSDYSMKGRTYRYMNEAALYPFGYGLSYTTFFYEKLGSVVEEDQVQLHFKISNTGRYHSRETVQAYVKVPGIDTPNAQLKGIVKVMLEAGEEREMVMSLKRDAFGLYDEEGKWLPGTGKLMVYLGGQAPDRRSEELMGQSVLVCCTDDI